MATKPSEVKAYLEALYQGCDRGHIVFVGSTRDTVSAVFDVKRLDLAAKHIEREPLNLFMKINVMDHEATKARNPQGIGGCDEVAAIVSLHLDVDAGKNKKYLTPQKMLDALDAMPLPPSMIIQTNGEDGGFHPYWLLDEPHYITDAADRQRCQDLSTRWLAELREHAKPGTIDGTANLDRILRPVGSLRASGNYVKTLIWNPSRRYKLEQFVLPDIEKPPAPIYSSEPRGDSESIIEKYLDAVGLNSVAAILSRQGYTHCRGGFWIRDGSESGAPTGEVYVKDGREGFTVKSGAADPLSCTNKKGNTGNWYSVESLFVSFYRNCDASNKRNPQAWTDAAAFCHEYLEPLKPKVDLSEFMVETKSESQEQAHTSWRHSSRIHTSETRGGSMNGSNGQRFKTVPERIEPVSIGSMIRSYPDLRPVVVDGILRRGETANIIASPKVGKSFLVGNLAWCVADGRPWLSHTVTQGRVLVIDNELHQETLASRLHRIGTDMQIDTNTDAIDVISLRGQNIDINVLEMRLAAITPGTYTLAIFDALYRTLPQGTSENDNAAMMLVYNRLDHYAAIWDAAIAVVHHSSKGAQGDKSVTDVGSGAGAISRAADTHIVIRPHEKPELCVLECVTRSFKSPEPVSIKFTYPLWDAVTTTPEVKRIGRTNTEQQAKDDTTARTEILAAIPIEPKAIQQVKLREKFDFGVPKFNRLIGGLVRGKQVKLRRKTKGKRELVYYTKVKSDSGNDSGNDSGTT
jgi:AAA domain